MWKQFKDAFKGVTICEVLVDALIVMSGVFAFWGAWVIGYGIAGN